MSTLKKTKKRVFAGVCGGISKWIDPDISPTGIRILWVILSLFHPFVMIITYLMLAATLRTELSLFQEEK